MYARACVCVCVCVRTCLSTTEDYKYGGPS